MHSLGYIDVLVYKIGKPKKIRRQAIKVAKSERSPRSGKKSPRSGQNSQLRGKSRRAVEKSRREAGRSRRKVGNGRREAGKVDINLGKTTAKLGTEVGKTFREVEKSTVKNSAVLRTRLHIQPPSCGFYFYMPYFLKKKQPLCPHFVRSLDIEPSCHIAPHWVDFIKIARFQG